mmetsp:Transcript_119321/g.370750  ORF Transcript_119321/g.370750 Transcript_119321/m.370750 type:complete len:397 (-) Transcript_119321:192-1382(-)
MDVGVVEEGALGYLAAHQLGQDVKLGVLEERGAEALLEAQRGALLILLRSLRRLELQVAVLVGHTDVAEAPASGVNGAPLGGEHERWVLRVVHVVRRELAIQAPCHELAAGAEQLPRIAAIRALELRPHSRDVLVRLQLGLLLQPLRELHVGLVHGSVVLDILALGCLALALVELHLLHGIFDDRLGLPHLWVPVRLRVLGHERLQALLEAVVALLALVRGWRAHLLQGLADDGLRLLLVRLAGLRLLGGLSPGLAPDRLLQVLQGLVNRTLGRGGLQRRRDRVDEVPRHGLGFGLHCISRLLRLLRLRLLLHTLGLGGLLPRLRGPGALLRGRPRQLDALRGPGFAALEVAQRILQGLGPARQLRGDLLHPAQVLERGRHEGRLQWAAVLLLLQR